MKKQVFLKSIQALTLSVLFVNPVFAQTLHDGTPIEHEVDTAHDSAVNDPSPQPQLRLKKPIPQDRLMVTGTLKSIAENVAHGALDAAIDVSPGMLPTTLSRIVHPKKPLTYADAIKNEPEIFNYYSLHKDRYVPALENGPALVNADHEYAGISDRKHGYCWGFATLVRYFTTLAFFDPSWVNPAPTDPKAYAEWIKFYQKKIDQVVRGQATLIPGFKNFRELSLVPELELYLKLNAMELWRSRAVKFSSLNIFRNATQSLSYNEVETLLKNLEARLARGELPKILFSALIPSKTVMGMNPDIHVVLVYGVERLPGNRARILIWDINFYTETLMRSPKYLEVTPEHGILYEPWYEPTKTYAKGSDLVASVKITPENDAEEIQMLKSLKNFCSKPENKRYCVMSWIHRFIQ